MAKHLLSAILYKSPDATVSSAQADHFTVYGIFISALYRCMFFFADFVYMHDNYSSLDQESAKSKTAL